MEKQFKFAPKLSLKELSLRRVLISCFNTSDVLASIPKFRVQHEEIRTGRYMLAYNEKWRVNVETKVKKKISELVLPETLKERMMYLFSFFDYNLREWYLMIEEYLDDSKISSDHVCWTSVGTINDPKTAENLIHSRALTAAGCFKLACLHCLTDSIPDLFQELPDHYKEIYKSFLKHPRIRSNVIDLEVYWPYVLNGQESKLDEKFAILLRPSSLSFNQYAFKSAAFEGNRQATKYFFQKLTNEERDDILVNTVCELAVKLIESMKNMGRFYSSEVDRSIVLCYLLSLMSPEQQMQAYKQRHVELLNCFQTAENFIREAIWKELIFDFVDVIFPQEI